MGVSIDIHNYDRGQLTLDIHKWVKDNGGYRDNAVPAEEFVSLVCPEFGTLSEKTFQVLWNEYYEEYNAGTNFLNAVDRYYFPGGTVDGFWSSAYDTVEGGALVEDVLESVFPTEFGYEGKFSDE